MTSPGSGLVRQEQEDLRHEVEEFSGVDHEDGIAGGSERHEENHIVSPKAAAFQAGSGE